MANAIKINLIMVLLALNACSHPVQRVQETTHSSATPSGNRDWLKPLNVVHGRQAVLKLSADKDRYVYDSRESMQFRVTARQACHVACYYQTTQGSIVKVFPNRFSPNGYFRANETKFFPNELNFSMLAGESGKFETLLCLSSAKKVDHGVNGVEGDLLTLPESSLEEIELQYRQLAKQALHVQSIEIEVR